MGQALKWYTFLFILFKVDIRHRFIPHSKCSWVQAEDENADFVTKSIFCHWPPLRLLKYVPNKRPKAVLVHSHNITSWYFVDPLLFPRKIPSF